jgi:serine protease DegQ
VTGGIVSAPGLQTSWASTPSKVFIQTDAAINLRPGGALVDVNGNLLGINTAILSRSGGSIKIGIVPVLHRRAGARR